MIQGDVSLEPTGAENFAQAELNYPLTLGDRVYVDLQGLAVLSGREREVPGEIFRTAGLAKVKTF